MTIRREHHAKSKADRGSGCVLQHEPILERTDQSSTSQVLRLAREDQQDKVDNRDGNILHERSHQCSVEFPLQVAAIPVAVLRGWDSKNRSVIKRAAFLPRNTCPELLHLPKREGGKGLQSLEHEIDILRIQTQMRMLNKQSKAGAVVRAAKHRHDGGEERSTI